jgi:hypothetical protein
VGKLHDYRQVALIAAKLSPPQAEELAESLETLTKEATRETPRRKWWELSAEGIREAAQSVGEIGTTAIALVGQLSPLWAG